VITDDSIRDALEHLAQHAPDPDRVLLGLAGRDRARRQRRALTIAGGAVAAGVAVGGPLVLLRDRHPAGPAGVAGPSARPSPSSSPSIVNDRIPMRYRPTWLPDGMREISRIAGPFSPDSDPRQQIRTWRVGTGGQSVQLQVGGADSVDTAGLRHTTVRGAAGWVDQRSGRPSVGVIWQPQPGVWLQVVVEGVAPGSTTVPLRVANSVTPDGSSMLEVPVAFGWLPDGITRAAQRTVASTAHGWESLVAADDGKGPVGAPVGVSATLGTAADVLVLNQKPGSTQSPGSTTARGVAATFVSPHILMVALPDGLGLRVAGEASQADLVRVADALRIGPVPDLSWLATG
jgi:hypothetical protein